MMIRKKGEAEELRVAVTSDRSAASEAFRTLRTNIQFMTLDKPVKSILIVGAHPGCGKSTTVINLAIALAQSGCSALLIDTDLRRPKLHHNFRCNNYIGITTLLIENDINLNAACIKTHITNLDLLPSGPVPPNPAELLASRRMKNVLNALQSHYDYILLDSPPILNIADASILSSLADATILVLGYGETTREEAVKTYQQLEMAKANLIGVVINGTPPHQDYYGYYGYYQEEPEDKKSRKKTRRSKKKRQLEEDQDLDFSVAFDK